ncbi:MAG: transglycosylase domain-containing protein [Defluviitaleaceae bacterium]|nr:transglycosylase domain-containing protein [Defluviitaleaceae bacterium]
MIFRICLSLMIIASFGAVGLVFGAYVGIIENTVAIENYRAVQPVDAISIVFDRHGNEIDRFIGAENREFVTLREIPENMRNAIIAIEDERFYSHNGIDMRAIARSLHQTLIGNTQGASTITQQVIKMSRNLQANDLESKLQEQYLAVRFEQMLIDQLGSRRAAKDYILEVYLNSIPMHHNISGVQAAAHFYFGGKDISEITLAEAVVLAGITNRPARYAPTINPENNRNRANLILDNMLRLEFIDEEEFRQAHRELDTLYDRVTQFRGAGAVADTTGQHIHSWFMDALIEQLIEDLQTIGYTRQSASNKVFNGGLRIYTSKDMTMQSIMDEVFMDDSFFPQRDFEIDVTYFLSVRNNITGQTYHFEENEQVGSVEEQEEFLQSVRDRLVTANTTLIADRYVAHPQPQASMVILDQHTGQVRAVIGGRGEKVTNRAFCRATQSTRQPGSVFKVPAAFAPAIDLGLMGAGSIIVDEPFSVAMPGQPNYEPRNWWGSAWRGPVTARRAIADSMNVATVRTMVETGVDVSFDYLLRFGFTTLVDGEVRGGMRFSDRGPATALGGLTDGVTQLEVTAAYAAMANGGIYRRPMFYTRVLDIDGNVILESDPERDSHVVIRSTTAYLLTNMMIDTTINGTGGQARFREVRIPVSGKTGTSQNTKDLTFVGYTPYYTAGIWMGHDRDNFISESGSPHLVIWRTIMERIHEDFTPRNFDRPTGIVNATLCRDSGLLAIPGVCNQDIRGNRTVNDIFAAGSVPTQSCDVHASVTIDTATGFLASAQTPANRLRTIIGIIVPDDEVGYSDHEIPASMAAGDPSVRLNNSFATIPSSDEGTWEIDPVTGELVFVPYDDPQGDYDNMDNNMGVDPISPNQPPATPGGTDVPERIVPSIPFAPTQPGGWSYTPSNVEQTPPFEDVPPFEPNAPSNTGNNQDTSPPPSLLPPVG